MSTKLHHLHSSTVFISLGRSSLLEIEQNVSFSRSHLCIRHRSDGFIIAPKPFRRCNIVMWLLHVAYVVPLFREPLCTTTPTRSYSTEGPPDLGPIPLVTASFCLPYSISRCCWGLHVGPAVN